jgi:hypothetical protein
VHTTVHTQPDSIHDTAHRWLSLPNAPSTALGDGVIVIEDTTFLDMVGAGVRARAEARAAGDTDAGGATCEVFKTQSSQAHDKAHMLKQMLST